MKVNVRNMESERSGRVVANQFIISTDDGRYFQSYGSVIAFVPFGGFNKTQLDTNRWDYSVTTGKYRNQFLGEGIAETRAKIASGEYVLTNLN